MLSVQGNCLRFMRWSNTRSAFSGSEFRKPKAISMQSSISRILRSFSALFRTNASLISYRKCSLTSGLVKNSSCFWRLNFSFRFVSSTTTDDPLR